MATAEEIKEGLHFIDFLNTHGLINSSIKEYTLQIKIYCNFVKKTPAELIEKAEKEEENSVRMKNRKIKCKRFFNLFKRQ